MPNSNNKKWLVSLGILIFIVVAFYTASNLGKWAANSTDATYDKENYANLEKNKLYKGVPALIVEVLSESTRTKDMVKKLDLYMQTGVREYWIVDPDKKSVNVYFFENHDIADHDAYMLDMTVKSKIFNGLEVKLAEIFTF